MCAAFFKLDDPKQNLTLQEAMEETQMVIFDVVEKLLKKTGIRPSEVRSQLPIRSLGGHLRDYVISHQLIVLFPQPILSKTYLHAGRQ